MNTLRESNVSGNVVIASRYRLLEPLGEGGMGVVYRAQDRLTGNIVALKKVTVERLDAEATVAGGDFRLALAREFRTLASLRHPHIISVLDYGFDEQPYFTMELLENTQTILEAARGASPADKVRLLIQTLQALAYLHRRGILHRDLKPDNVQVIDGQVKLVDFGLSVARGQEDTSIAGTLYYMAPEVLQGFPPSEASDLYAVGVIAYEMFGGAYPYDLSSVSTLVRQIVYTAPDVHALDIDEQLARTLERLLAKSPADRFANAAEALAFYGGVAETEATRESFLQAAQFVGREAELNTLSAALDSAIKGQGSGWLVGGESGVGKSRLLDELRILALVKGAHVLRGQSVSEGGRPYRLWWEAARWLSLQSDLSPLEAQVLKTLVPDIAALLGCEVDDPPELDPQATQDRLHTTLEQAFRRQKHLMVVLLEDIHWARSESLALLRRLTRDLDKVPLLIVASFRDDESPTLPQALPEMRLLKLERLDEASIAALSVSMLGVAGRRPQVIELLQRETEGNAFFMVEVVRALAEEVGQLDQIGTITLPERVFAGGMQVVIRRRLERVPESARPLLRIAAVAGRELSLELLHEIDPETHLDEWLTVCANAAVLDVQDGRWRFSHDHLREALLAGIPADQTRVIHWQIASTLERLYPDAPDQLTALAYHWEQAGEAAKQAHYRAAAGEQALHSGAYREALTLLKNALTTGQRFSQSRQAAIERLIGEAYYALGELQRSREHLERSLMLLGRPLPRTLTPSLVQQVAFQLCHRLMHSPRPLEIDSGQLTTMALAYERIAQICVLTNDSAASVYTALSMLNLTERASPSPELARAYVNVAFIAGVIPQRAWADTYAARAWETAQRVNNPSATGWVLEIRSMYDIGVCRWAQAEAGFLRAIEIAEQIGDLRKRDESSGLLSIVYYHTGRLKENYERSLQIYESTVARGDKYLQLSTALQIMGYLLRAAHPGYLDEAAPYLEESFRLLTGNFGVEMEILTNTLAAVTYLLKGDGGQARQLADKSLSLAQKSRPALCYAMEGYACLPEIYFTLWECSSDANERQTLLRQGQRACAALHKYAQVFLNAVPRAWLWQGVYDHAVGKSDAAGQALSKALAAAQQYHMPFDEALILLEAGRRGSPAQVEQALTLFETLGAQRDAQRARDALKTLQAV